MRAKLGADSLRVGLYSPSLAARITKIRPQCFQAWIKAKLLRPASKITVGERSQNIYSYRDLLLIRLIQRLRDKGFSVEKIRKTLDSIANAAGGNHGAWMNAIIYADKGLIAAALPDAPSANPIAVSQGSQTLSGVFFPDLVDGLEMELVPAHLRHIEVNPEVLGGAPVIKGTRIPTHAVSLTRGEGQYPSVLYPQLTKEQVAEAVAYENSMERV